MKWILACAGGIALVSFVPALPPPLLGLPLILFFLSSLKYQRLKYLGALVIGLLWGFSYGWLGLQAILPDHLEGQELRVVGQVAGLPVQTERYQHFTMDVSEARLDGDGAIFENFNRIRINWYSLAQPVKPGEVWQFKVKLKRPHGLANPGTFSYETWLFRHGINATGYVRKDPENRRLATPLFGRWIDRFRFNAFRELDSVLHETRYGALLSTLMLGQGSQLGAGQWALFTRTGTNHLFVISGLHVGFVALCAYLLAWHVSRLLLLGPPRFAAQRVATVAALIGAGGYCAMAGFSLPTQRAFIMLLVMLGGKLLQRRMNIWQGYSVALLIVLLLDPLAPQSGGFWLSFVAVGGLLLAFQGHTRQTGFWWQWVRPQWVVFLVLMPILVVYFQQVSLVGPLANLLAIPVVGFVVVPLSLLGGLLTLVHVAAAQFVFQCADQILGVVMAYLEFLDQWAWISQAVQLDGPTAVFALCGALLLMLPAGLPARSLGIVCLLGLFVKHPEPLAPQSYRVLVFDVGQGFAALVQAPGHNLLYDTGPKFSDRFNAAEAVILPYLRQQGISRVDRLVVSHGDQDHAGAIEPLLQGMMIDAVISDAELHLEHAARSCSSAQHWQWGGVEFTLMSAVADARTNANNSSCVLRISNGQHAVLLAGDIESRAEFDLVRQFGERLKVDILMAPHHGSLTSSSEWFLNRVRPKHVVVSSGYRNRFGHPHPKIVQRYNERDIVQHRTARDGAILFEFDATSELPKISAYRRQARRYWLE